MTGSKRIALCTVTPEGTACCSFAEGSYAYRGGLRDAVQHAAAYATPPHGALRLPYRCGCDGVRRRNVGVGVVIFQGFEDRFDEDKPARVIGVARYEPAAADLEREREDRRRGIHR